MLITSLNNNHIKDIIKLKDKKYRDLTNTFIVEGRHLVLEAYKTGTILELILEKDELFPLDVETTYVTKEIINKISDNVSSNNIMAIVRKKEEQPIGERVIILDNIQDPGNLGTIIRSATAFNIDTIIISKDTVDLYNPKVVRATQGMLFHNNVIVRDIKLAIKDLQEDGYKIIGTNVTNGTDVKTSKTYNHFALIIGNEGHGLSDDILKLCNEYLYIKMNEDCESLNVAVAASILMYELYNR